MAVMEWFETSEAEGWRLADTGDDSLAIDNKPAVEAAKKRGEITPDFQHVVVPFALVIEFIEP